MGSGLPMTRRKSFSTDFYHTQEPRRKWSGGTKSHAICYKRAMRLHDYAPRPAVLKWLLDSDPAIRWQVMKDLTDEAPDAIAAERSRVATEGWEPSFSPA